MTNYASAQISQQAPYPGGQLGSMAGANLTHPRLAFLPQLNKELAEMCERFNAINSRTRDTLVDMGIGIPPSDPGPVRAGGPQNPLDMCGDQIVALRRMHAEQHAMVEALRAALLG